MSKIIVVENDKVEGKDKHNVSGNSTNPAPPPPPTITYTGVGEFDYIGKMTDELSDFVKINGLAVVLKSSKSSLNPGEDVAPAGKHSGPMGSNFVPPYPPSPPLVKNTLTITEPVGEGIPSASSGSLFVKVAGVEVILDGDKIDTCDGLGIPMNSTVTAENQDFVFCAE